MGGRRAPPKKCASAGVAPASRDCRVVVVFHEIGAASFHSSVEPAYMEKVSAGCLVARRVTAVGEGAAAALSS